MKKYKMQMCKAKLREGVKKQIFYSQADHKRISPPPESATQDLPYSTKQTY